MSAMRFFDAEVSAAADECIVIGHQRLSGQIRWAMLISYVFGRLVRTSTTQAQSGKKFDGSTACNGTSDIQSAVHSQFDVRYRNSPVRLKRAVGMRETFTSMPCPFL